MPPAPHLSAAARRRLERIPRPPTVNERGEFYGQTHTGPAPDPATDRAACADALCRAEAILADLPAPAYLAEALALAHAEATVALTYAMRDLADALLVARLEGS